METLKFFEKIDLPKIEHRFKALPGFSFDGKSISFSLDSCKFTITSESIECEFPSEKYFVIANTLLNIIDTSNSPSISKLIELVGSTEFSRNGQLDSLIQSYKSKNESLTYENLQLKTKLNSLESALSLQESQLSELRKKLMSYETVPDSVVSEMIVSSIREDSRFSITMFAKKNSLTPHQVSKCLQSLLETGTISVLDSDYYAKPFQPGLYSIQSIFSRLLNSLKKKQ